jgi:hypothetical protein
VRDRDDSSLLERSIAEPVVCAKCADEVAAGDAGAVSIAEYQRLDVGFSPHGFQVWCRRHDVNVVHLDFDGGRPAADFRCFEPKPGGIH